MKKFLNLHPKFIRFVFLLVTVLACLSFAYSRYENYRLTPRISEEVKNAPLKIDTSSVELEDGKSYRLPRNIANLVGVYKGLENGHEVQVRVNPDGTYEIISKGERLTETYLDKNGELRYKQEETVGLEIGILVEEHGYVRFYRYKDTIDDDTLMGLEILSNGLYIDSDGKVDLLKSMFQKLRREAVFRHNEYVPQDVLTIDETNAVFTPNFLLFDKEKLVSYSYYHAHSFRAGPFKTSYTPKSEFTRSKDVYDIWAQPIEKWAIEEVLIEEVTLSDFLKMYGSSIRKTAKELWKIANSTVEKPTDAELESYIKENGRATTDEELAHIKKKYGVEFDVSFTIENNKEYYTTINVFGWSEDTGFDEFGLLKENGRF